MPRQKHEHRKRQHIVHGLFESFVIVDSSFCFLLSLEIPSPNLNGKFSLQT